MSAVLYRMFNEAGDLLYAGSTMHMPSRLSGHLSDKPWATEIAVIKLEHFPTREAAFEAETAVIVNENPRYNRSIISVDFRKPLAKDADKTISRQEPWKAEGMSRASWYRRQRGKK